jgi:hypothetical protein
MAAVRKLALAGVTVLIGTLSLGSAPAGAETGYDDLCPSLQTALCNGPDQFVAEDGYDMAVDNSSGSSGGDVWFEKGAHNEGDALAKYNASGNLLLEVGVGSIPPPAVEVFSPPPPGEGGYNHLEGVAVDPTNGDVYISTFKQIGQTGSDFVGDVTKFNSSGVFQFQLTGSETPQHSWGVIGGLAVGSSGELYLVDAGGWIDKFTSSGKYAGQFPLPSGASGTMAVGPEGNLYLGEAEQVSEYSPTGAPVDCSDGSNALHVEGEGAYGEPVAVDPSNGHIYAYAYNEAEGTFTVEYSSLCATAPSAKVGAHEGGGGPGIAVNSTTHMVYVTQYQREAAQIYEQVTLPDTTTSSSPPTNIQRKSAELSGTVNPAGTEVTTCEFEWGTTGAYGQSEPCTQALPLTGSSTIAVTTVLHLPLPPASLVYYRLKSGNAKGTTYGEGYSFFLESLPPPVVGGLSATDISQFAATINGTLETGEALVDYRFEYGTSTAYGSVQPIPNGVTPVTTEKLTITEPITDLQAGTTYHYRLIASSPGATEVKGPDETFTTLPVTAPEAVTGASSEVGVGSATVVGTVDPHGWNTTYLFEYGTSTAYGSNWPTVLVDMGALEGPQPVIVTIPNLQPKTTYHYRLIASSAGGSSYGQDMTFTTGEYPAQVIEEPPSLGTLLVPSGNETAKSPGKKAKKAKKNKKHPKSKRRVRRKKKR